MAYRDDRVSKGQRALLLRADQAEGRRWRAFHRPVISVCQSYKMFHGGALNPAACCKKESPRAGTISSQDLTITESIIAVVTMPDNVARSVRRCHDQWRPRGAKQFQRLSRAADQQDASEVYLVQSTEAPGGIGEPGSIGAVPALTCPHGLSLLDAEASVQSPRYQCRVLRRETRDAQAHPQ